MFIGSKFSLFMMILLAISSVTTYAKNPPRQIFEICTPTGDCSAVIPADKSAGLCEAQPAKVAWHKASDRYIVQCDCNCTDKNNKNWIVDEGRKITRRINFGKYVTKQLFVSSISPKVPDKFSSHSMCQAAQKNLIEKSDFVVLDKVPSTGKDDPYCYEPYYIAFENENFDIRDNFHQLSAKDSHFLSIENNLITVRKINEIIQLTK